MKNSPPGFSEPGDGMLALLSDPHGRRRVMVWGGAALGVVLFAIAAESVFRAVIRARAGNSEAAARVSESEHGGPLYEPREPKPVDEGNGHGIDPIIVTDCRLAAVDKQDVAGQRDGVLLFVGEEVDHDVAVPADRLLIVKVGTIERRIRRWKEGDQVRPGQLLAQIDDRLARDDYEIKKAKLAAARADLVAAEKTRDAARERYDTQLSLRSSRATPLEEVRAAKLNWDRYTSEAVSKREGVALAEKELNQAKTVLELHQVRATITGVIKTIYKQAGESVKSLDPVVQVQGTGGLRAEGLLDVKHRSRLALGMRAIVEPALDEGPLQTLVGHLQEVGAVAVGKSGTVVSGSEDGTVRVWDRSKGRERRILHHPAPVRSLACTSLGAEADLCLSGAGDGVARLWNLAADSDEPLRVLEGRHSGAVTCVAFSLNGRFCATGGEDREIIVSDVSTGATLYRLPAGHRAAISSLQFTPRTQLVSAGRDSTLRVWSLHERGAALEATFDRRSGEVNTLDASPDGGSAIFDQGQALRVLSLPKGLTEGVLRQPTGGARFATFARFSPDGRLILTAIAGESRTQLWRTPAGGSRAYELRGLIAGEGSVPTCAAFAPDGSFAVTGTRDRHVLVWAVPSKQDLEREVTATVTLLERSQESSTRQVRIWAELNDPVGRLLPGGSVTLVLYPETTR